MTEASFFECGAIARRAPLHAPPGLWEKSGVSESKRDQNKKANRDALLASARAVLSQLGYGAATVRDIVRGSGLAPGSFYNYFHDKEAVFEALVAEIMQPLAENLRRSRREAETVEAFLRAPFALAAEVALKDPDNALLIARNQTIFRRIFYLADSKTDIQKDLEKDLLDWTALRRIQPHDAALMAETMIALGVDLVVQVSQAPETAEARISFLVSLFRNSLEPVEGR